MFLSQKMDADGLIHRYEITRFLIYWTIFPKSCGSCTTVIRPYLFSGNMTDRKIPLRTYTLTGFNQNKTASQLLGHSDINTTLKITIEKRIRDANPFFYGKAIGKQKQTMRHKYFL